MTLKCHVALKSYNKLNIHAAFASEKKMHYMLIKVNKWY